jgi:hypothetical protein
MRWMLFDHFYLNPSLISQWYVSLLVMDRRQRIKEFHNYLFNDHICPEAYFQSKPLVQGDRFLPIKDQPAFVSSKRALHKRSQIALMNPEAAVNFIFIHSPSYTLPSESKGESLLPSSNK